MPILADLERTGVRVDVHALAAQAALVEREMHELGARDLPRSPAASSTSTRPSSWPRSCSRSSSCRCSSRPARPARPRPASRCSRSWRSAHELPRLILEWRGLAKLKGTYIDALPTLVNPETGRVHTQFNQAVAATGRLSSSDPNLQNIPIRTELGREIRRAFVAEPGHRARVRGLLTDRAAGSGAPVGRRNAARRLRARRRHPRSDRAKVFGADSGLSTHELRRRAKIINYALLYGKTAFTLAKDIGVTQQAAQQFIDAYFAGFPRVRGFIDQTLEDARRTGVVKTMFGRRRAVPEITSRNGADPVGGGAHRRQHAHPGDRRRHSQAGDDRGPPRAEVRAPAARMILTVHDELLFEAPAEEADAVASLVAARMAGAVQLRVPLDVDVGVGENWKEAKS